MKNLSIVVVILALVASLLGCSSKPTPAPVSTAAPTAAPKPTTAPTVAPNAAAKPTPAPTPAVPAKLLQGIRIGTAAEGSGVFVIATAMARIAEKYIPGAKVSVVPTAGAVASMQLLGKGTGECDSGWALSADLVDMYSSSGPFAATPPKWLPYLTWHSNTGESFIITKADRKDINSLHDLIGKKVFLSPAGTGTYTLARSVLTALGIYDKIVERQMGYAETGDALQLGSIDAALGYTNNYTTVVPWVAQMESRIRIKIVVPSKEEQDAINKLSFTSGTWKTEVSAFSRDVGTDKIFAWTTISSSDYSPDVDAESVYRLVKAFDEHAKELSDLAPTHVLPYKLGLQFQADMLDTFVGKGIPVHPGMAQYLKEKGLWNSKLTVGEYKKRPGS